jgi:cardiolipin synthase A/B
MRRRTPVRHLSPPHGSRHRERTSSLTDPQAIRPLRQLGAQALSRASGAPLVLGNQARILEDADGNYPVWLAAIRAARRVIYLENYIFEEDEVGNAFAEALAERAQAGVRVRLIRDWLGTRTGSSRSFWRRLTIAGVEVRAFNRLRLDSPFGWISRDHRKMVAIDGEVAFVTGLCISQRWKGDPGRGIAPWRDTGVEIRGPAVADVEHAFAQLWETMGDPVPAHDLSSIESLPRVGEVALRVVAGTPTTAGLFRMDQLVAAVASHSLWLTDAYFVGVTPYVQALRSAARDGVDVRLLIPNTTDLPLLRPLSRAGYRPLLEAGVRIFEWNGSMLHAKTAVADRRWSRIGSTNLNLASFLGNYELDVAIEDEGVAKKMEEMYLRDLENSTEIELERNRVVSIASSGTAAMPGEPGRESIAGKTGNTANTGNVGVGSRANRRGSGRAAAGAIRVANVVGAAVTNHRVLGAAEGKTLLFSGLALVVLAGLATIWPRIIAIPVTVLLFWIGLSLVWRARGSRTTVRTPRRLLPAVTEATSVAEREDVGTPSAEMGLGAGKRGSDSLS